MLVTACHYLHLLLTTYYLLLTTYYLLPQAAHAPLAARSPVDRGKAGVRARRRHLACHGAGHLPPRGAGAPTNPNPNPSPKASPSPNPYTPTPTPNPTPNPSPGPNPSPSPYAHRCEAREHPLLLLEPGSRAVLEDVLVGYWLRANRQLKMVQLPGDMWAGGFKGVGRLGRLLVAHQVPWRHLAWLTAQADQLWGGSGARVSSRLGCFGPMCAAGNCAHHTKQRACALRIEVAPMPHGGGDDDAVGASCRGCACDAGGDGSGSNASRIGTRGVCPQWDRTRGREQAELACSAVS